MKITKKHKEQKWKEAITLFNDIVRTQLRPSSIHGIGVFALRDLKKGDKLYADVVPNASDLPYSKLKKLRPEVKQAILNAWPNIINGAHFLYPVTKTNAFINHSDTPNYDINNDEIITDVKAGEEITMDYRLYQNYNKLFKWLK